MPGVFLEKLNPTSQAFLNRQKTLEICSAFVEITLVKSSHVFILKHRPNCKNILGNV